MKKILTMITALTMVLMVGCVKNETVYEKNDSGDSVINEIITDVSGDFIDKSIHPNFKLSKVTTDEIIITNIFGSGHQAYTVPYIVSPELLEKGIYVSYDENSRRKYTKITLESLNLEKKEMKIKTEDVTIRKKEFTGWRIGERIHESWDNKKETAYKDNIALSGVTDKEVILSIIYSSGHRGYVKTLYIPKEDIYDGFEFNYYENSKEIIARITASEENINKENGLFNCSILYTYKK